MWAAVGASNSLGDFPAKCDFGDLSRHRFVSGYFGAPLGYPGRPRSIHRNTLDMVLVVLRVVPGGPGGSSGGPGGGSGGPGNNPGKDFFTILLDTFDAPKCPAKLGVLEVVLVVLVVVLVVLEVVLVVLDPQGRI